VNTQVNSVGQYLTFVLADEEYAINILKITDIIECGVLTKVPGTPPWIRGVHNLRGTVIPVVDLAIKFGMLPTVITPRTCIIIVELSLDGDRLVMGVMADSVQKVVDLGPDDIHAAPEFGPRVRVDCLIGMGNGQGKFVLLLDIDKVLSYNEVLAAAAVPAETPRLEPGDLKVTALTASEPASGLLLQE
jgi:purine-binding chemotaxis protein CheW